MEPSPKFQEYVNVSPSESKEPVPSNAMDESSVPLYGPLASAVGGLLGSVLTLKTPSIKLE